MGKRIFMQAAYLCFIYFFYLMLFFKNLIINCIEFFDN